MELEITTHQVAKKKATHWFFEIPPADLLGVQKGAK